MAFGHQRTESRRLLLREIASHGPIARIDLAEQTGISRATVTTVTADLLRGGLIEEIARDGGGDDARRGRPRVDLKISGRAHMVAGLKVSDANISLVLMDFEGRDLAQHACAIPTGAMSPDALAGHIADGVAALAAAGGVRMQDISGVGVGLAGILDADAGRVYWSPSLNARNVDFRDLLADRLGVPTFLDNDANLVAMAELAFGLGQGHSDFIVITIESGVGMGMVLGGQVYRGARGSGGEFGHTKVQLEGALCRCGQRGCLEAYVADFALAREAASVGGVDAGGPPGAVAAAVLKAAKAGDPVAKSVVERAGRMFAIGLANMVNILDPQLIILAGEQMQFDHLYADAVIEDMRKASVQIDRAPPEVVIHKWGNAMWARGAAAYALEFVQDLAVQELENA